MKKFKISILLVSLALLTGAAYGGPPGKASAEPNDALALQGPAIADSNEQAATDKGAEQRGSKFPRFLLFIILIVLVVIAISCFWGMNYIYINEETVKGFLTAALFLVIFSFLNAIEWDPRWFAWALVVSCFVVYIIILISRCYEAHENIKALMQDKKNLQSEIEKLRGDITLECIASLKEKIKSQRTKQGQPGSYDIAYLFNKGIPELFDAAVNNNKADILLEFFGAVKILPSALNGLYLLALRQKSLECLEIIIAQPGFDRDWTSNGDTGLHIAMMGISENSPEIAKVLLETELDPNAANNTGETALHILAGQEKGDLRDRLIQLLIDSGADTELKNNKGETALDILKEAEGITKACALLSGESTEAGNDAELPATAEAQGPAEKETQEPEPPEEKENEPADEKAT